MRRALPVALLAALGACKMPRPAVPIVRTGGDAARLPAGLRSHGRVLGDAIWFPDGAGSGGVLWNARTRTLESEGAGLRLELAEPGGLRSLVSDEPRMWVRIEGAAGERRVLSALGDALPVAVSPEGEDARGFDVAVHSGATCIAWCASDGRTDATRVAFLDRAGNVQTTRVPFDPDRLRSESPTVAAIGIETEPAFLVAYESSARADTPPQVRVTRVAYRETGSLQAALPRTPAFALAESRDPRLASVGQRALLAFAGRRAEGEDEWIFVVPISDQGDPLGEPVALVPAFEDGARRTHPAPYAVAGRWVLAWEETRGSGETSVVVAPLAIE